MKQSGMPESMYNETKNEWDQLEGLTGGGGGGGEGDNFIGPKLPHGNSGHMAGANISDEKDGKEEKQPPNYGDEDIDVDMISADNADLPDNDNEEEKEKEKEKKKEKEEKEEIKQEPPVTHRQTSI
eukprot:982958_1